MYEEALKMLDIQYEEIWKRRIGEKRNVQYAFYNGAKAMFEGLTGKKLNISMEGKHSVKEDA